MGGGGWGEPFLFSQLLPMVRIRQLTGAAFARHSARFSAADFVKSVVHFRDDMEPIENVQRL